jgi:hypothetical protein
MNPTRSLRCRLAVTGMAFLTMWPVVGTFPTALASPSVSPSAIALVVAPTVTPATGPAGSSIVLTAPAGSYPAGVQAGVNFQDSSKNYAGIFIGRTTILPDGSLNFALRIPDEATAGPALLFLSVNNSSNFTTFVVQPSIRLSAVSSPAGGAVMVTGSGFAGNGAISFTVNGQDATVLTRDAVIVDTFGSFSGFIGIPNGVAGSVTISATDGTYTATAQVAITATIGAAGTTPILGGPASGAPTPTTVLSGTVGPGSVASPPAPTGATTAYFAEGFTGAAATNGKATYRESLDFLNANPIEATVDITYVVVGESAPVVVEQTIPAESVLREDVNNDVGPDQQVSAIVTSSQRIFVDRVIARVSSSGERLDSSATQPAAAPARTWLFPEGYTGATFQEYLTVLNPGTRPATMTVTLAPQGVALAHPRALTFTVPALSRSTTNVTALNAGDTAKSVGMVVAGNRPIVAERVLYFGDGSGSGKFGATVSGGIAGPAKVLGLVASGGASQNFLTLLNPAPSGASVSVTASVSDAAGQAVGAPTTLTVAPGTRQTFTLPQAAGVTGGPAGILLNATGPIAAEAVQYYGGSPNVGDHPGVVYPAQGAAAHTVYVPDVSTSLADSTPITRTVYLYNPGATPITVDGFYLGSAGASAEVPYTVPAAGITTVNVNADSALPTGPIGAVFTVTTDSGALVASSLGLTADGKSATESVGIPGS